ncbi:MAG: radical SAM protein [Gemmatimonadales bacterium]
MVETERTRRGDLERAATVFLAGAECPFTCSFCDLWRWTVDGPTPAGALPIQVARALEQLERPFPERLKLYNASNFFDRRAVPPQDLPALAELAEPFGAVTVEAHANLVGSNAVEFNALLSGRLEVAIGLETIHPGAIAQLNKRLELPRFERAAEFLTRHDMDLRVFVLLGAPHIAPAESVEWTVRTVEYAAAHGATRIAIIPVRGGNGEMERLAALGLFYPPTLAQLETALDRVIATRPAVVTADLWDTTLLPGCTACHSTRTARLERMNCRGIPEPPISCSACA